MQNKQFKSLLTQGCFLPHGTEYTKGICTKQPKYQAGGLVSAYCHQRFFSGIVKLFQGGHYQCLLDVGCGEGIPLLNILPALHGSKVCGIDLDEEKLPLIQKNIPGGAFLRGSIYNLPYSDKTFDLVLCLEVLEHLNFPEKAMEEIHRVAAKDILFSVPNEPLWSCLNLLRFKYIRNHGNTPAHLQRWSSAQFQNMVQKHFTLKSLKKITPWTIVLCTV